MHHLLLFYTQLPTPDTEGATVVIAKNLSRVAFVSTDPGSVKVTYAASPTLKFPAQSLPTLKVTYASFTLKVTMPDAAKITFGQVAVHRVIVDATAPPRMRIL